MQKQSMLILFSSLLCISSLSLSLYEDNFGDPFINLSRQQSDLADIITMISLWDEDKDSPVHQLNRYILDGNAMALKDDVLEVLSYAELVVEEQVGKRSQEQLDKINDALDALADQMRCGELFVNRGCDKISGFQGTQEFDCGHQPPCCKRGPRGHRGHRGHRGATGATGVTGATGATGTFNSSSCVDICATNLTVINCVSSLCVNTLSVVDETVSGQLTTCDVVVGCDLFLHDSLTLPVGNVIKNGRPFNHTFPGSASFNTFLGQDAGNFTTMTGNSNTGLGYHTLIVNAAGSNNTAVGTFALSANVGGAFNTAVGSNALSSNIGTFSNGFSNTAVGSNALASNTTGTFNSGFGDSALLNNISGTENTALGVSALVSNTNGGRNTAVGVDALQNNTTGEANTAVGQSSLISCITGVSNVAVGQDADSAGNFNVIVGAASGNMGDQNVGVGFQTLTNNNSNNNVAVGFSSLFNLSSVNGDNTGVGFQSLMNVQGSFNIAIGSGAGISLTTGSGNIYIDADAVTLGESNTTRIGTGQTACFIQGINGVTTGLPAVAVLVDGNGQLGTISSTRKVKHAICNMADASANIYNLRPVTFVYNGDASETRQYGLIAEEADEVFPALVVYDQEGQPFTIQYHVLPVLLLNEMQKQQRVIAQQNVAIENIHHRLELLEEKN